MRKKTRVLFVAWGESIHARRRIGLFCDDHSFEVGVISTFPYDFANAQNFYLAGVLQADLKVNSLSRILVRCIYAMPGSLLYLVMRFFGGASLGECSNFIRDVLLVRRYIKKFKPDVIFLQTLMYPCYLANFWLGSTPIIVTFWNGDVTWWAKWTGVERAFKKMIVERGVRRAAEITVNSQAARQACLGYGAEAEKVNLIRYPGVDLKMFSPYFNKKEIRKQLGIPDDGRVVFCPRGLGGYLNSDIIVEAAALVVKQFPKATFVFLVNSYASNERDAHQKIAEELAIVSNLLFISNIPWDSMPSYYRAADVMVSISSNDSLPNCMLEAMACGVPVIMGDIPQIREWVIDGQNGFAVPTRDPTALANRIVRAFLNSGGVVDGFVRSNLDLVRRAVDSQLVANEIKSLVRRTAKL